MLARGTHRLHAHHKAQGSQGDSLLVAPSGLLGSMAATLAAIMSAYITTVVSCIGSGAIAGGADFNAVQPAGRRNSDMNTRECYITTL